MTDPSNQSILLDIYERLGGIETKLTAVSEIKAELNKLDERTTYLEVKVGKVMWVGGGIAAVAILILWRTIEYGVNLLLHKFGG